MSDPRHLASIKSAAADANVLFSSMELSPSDHALASSAVAGILTEAEQILATTIDPAEQSTAARKGVARLEVYSTQVFGGHLQDLLGNIQSIKFAAPPVHMATALSLLEQEVGRTQTDLLNIGAAICGDGASFVELMSRPLSECRLFQALIRSFEKNLADSRKWWGSTRELVVRIAISFIVGLILLPVGIVLKSALDDRHTAHQQQPASAAASLPSKSAH